MKIKMCVLIIALIACLKMIGIDDACNYIKYRNNWAFFNYGQTINTIKGCKGIDIGMTAISNSKQRDNDQVKVAVVDSGVYNKPDACYYSNIQKGWDYYNEDDSVYDAYSFDYHGTYIANEIYAICPDATFIPVKFMSGTRGNTNDCVKAVKYAIEQGARIINCSWCFDSQSEDLEKIIRDNSDVLFVSAAGNMLTNLDNVKMYPCGYDYENILTVGAMDANGFPTDISGYGRKSVDVFAPGENVAIILPDNDHDYIDGTSIATAIVTGVCARVMSSNNELSPKDVTKIIRCSSSRQEALKDKCKSGGYVQINKALIMAEKNNERKK